MHGRVAYTQQDPWIQNATLRDNILMGSPLDQARYDRVLDACALRPDLDVLPAGVLYLGALFAEGSLIVQW